MGEYLEVLAEKIRTIERELRDIKADVKSNSSEIDKLETSRETNLIKLDLLDKKLESIQTSISKDTGWRGFFIDFIKAAAQIAVLVGAGKWIL